MSKNTVYIIGAGASCEAGLPIGNTLKNKISDIFKPVFRPQKSNAIYDALSHLSSLNSIQGQNNHIKYINECHHLAASLPLAISIDNFLDAHKDNQDLILCGKLSIVKSILDAERESRLFSDSGIIDFASLDDTWYTSFFRSITENCTLKDLKSRFEKITLIIFNYDRCVEHFLFIALKIYYKISEKIALDIVNSLKIIHPYGHVGHLKWQDQNHEYSVNFGDEVKFYNLIKFSEKIRTFTEGACSEDKQKIIDAMESAERLVFLGFAFHDINMRLLSNDGGQRYKNDHMVCYATAFGSSKADISHIETLISHLYENAPATSIENIKCNQIFLDYSREPLKNSQNLAK